MLILPDRRTFEPRAYDGWALEAAARFETARPGFLIRTFYASSLKRQALFAALADLKGESSDVEAAHIDTGLGATARDTTLREFADAFATLNAERMVKTVFGSCPRSYLVMLAQIGEAPIASKTFYRTAFELCAKADGAPAASLE